MTTTSDFDAYVQRLQNVPPFTICHPTQDGNDVVEWYKVDPAQVVREAIIDHLNIPAQVSLCAAQIQTWGRYKSIAQRVVDIVERRYRIWRDSYCLTRINKAKKDGEKVPTEKILERMYRCAPAYHHNYRRIEEAEEVLNAVSLVLEAFKTKANLLGAHSPMFRDLVR